MKLGYDPVDKNLPENMKTLQEVNFIPIKNINEFTFIDIDYFKKLIDECKDRNYFPISMKI